MDINSDIFCLSVSKHKKEWRILSSEIVIGSGKYGKVIGICDKNDCSYVMKVIKLSSKYSEKDFKREVSVHKSLAKLGISVPIEDYWICIESQIAVIVMRVMEITVKDFLVGVDSLEDVNNILEGVKHLLDEVHENGFFHGDNHFGNIMMKRVYKDEKNTVDTSKGKYRLYFIDFGKSGAFAKSKTPKERRIRIDNLIHKEESTNALIPYINGPETLII